MKQLEPKEKNAFRLHLIYSIIDGIILGLLALNEFVFIKGMKGSSFQLSLLIQFSTILLIFSIFFHEFVKRIKNKKLLLRWVAIFTRAPLLLLLVFPNESDVYLQSNFYHAIFLMVFLCYFFATPIVNPIFNLQLKNAYQQQNFGKLYSYATTVNKFVMLFITFFYGLLLDSYPYYFAYLLPAAGLLGIIAIFIFSVIPIPYIPQPNPLPIFKSLKQSIANMLKIMKGNKPFRDFEIGFMFYGFAFLSTIGIINIFFDKELHLNYVSVAFYKNSYNILAILLLPMFGKLINRIDPRKFAAITFASIGLYLSFLIVTYYFPQSFLLWDIQVYYGMIFYVLMHGVFAATMGLLWSIGSIYFCEHHNADHYQAIHLTLTGQRAVFAPFIGVICYHFFGFTGTFAIGAAAAGLGVWVVIRSSCKFKLIK